VNVNERRFKHARRHLKRSYRTIRPLLGQVLDRGNSDIFAAVEVRNAFRELNEQLRKLGLYQFGVGARRP